MPEEFTRPASNRHVTLVSGLTVKQERHPLCPEEVPLPFVFILFVSMPVSLAESPGYGIGKKLRIIYAVFRRSPSESTSGSCVGYGPFCLGVYFTGIRSIAC